MLQISVLLVVLINFSSVFSCKYIKLLGYCSWLEDFMSKAFGGHSFCLLKQFVGEIIITTTTNTLLHQIFALYTKIGNITRWYFLTKHLLASRVPFSGTLDNKNFYFTQIKIACVKLRYTVHITYNTDNDLI